MSVSMKNVFASYGEEETWSLEDINIEIDQGEVVGIIGPTGSGKTTLLLTLKGLLPHVLPGRVQGHISVDGMAITSKAAETVGLVLPDPNLSIVALTVEDDLAFGPQCMGLPTEEIQKRVYESLDLFRLRGYEKRVTYTLSGGESQATSIASIYAMKPKVLALDEPLSMIDPLGRETVLGAIKKLIAEQHATVLITESGDTIEYTAPICERFVVLSERQKIADGPTREILGDRELFRRIRIRPPQVTELAYNLQLPKEKLPLTVEEATVTISQLLKTKLPELKSRSEHKVSQVARRRVIEVRNLHHIFPGLHPVHALKGINLDINEGEIVGIIGQNGSGKTTLALHLVGIYKPTNPDAKVIVDGVEVHSTKTPLSKIIDHINYVFQNPDNQLFTDTVEEEVTYALKMQGLPKEDIDRKVDSILALYGMQNYRKKPIMHLTKAEKTFLAQASVLVMHPKILVVDEPTTGLDHEMGEKVMTILRRLNRDENCTILIITHNMNLVAKYTDRLIVMSQGEILLDGPTREVFSETKVLAQCSISPPQIIMLSQNLGLQKDVMAVEEMTDLLRNLINMG